VASTRTYDDRVDDTILVGALRISRLRHISLHEAIELHIEQCRLNLDDGVGQMVEYWSHRIRRGEVLRERTAGELHKQAVDALIREEKG